MSTDLDQSATHQPNADRRRFLQAGSARLLTLGFTGNGLATAADSLSRKSNFGRAKSVVVLFLYGAPSQMDTLDPKPQAPVEVRGKPFTPKALHNIAQTLRTK